MAIPVKKKILRDKRNHGVKSCNVLYCLSSSGVVLSKERTANVGYSDKVAVSYGLWR